MTLVPAWIFLASVVLYACVRAWLDRSRRKDPGAVVFEHVERLLLERAVEWEEDYPWWRLGNIIVIAYGGTFRRVRIDQSEITPNAAWQHRIQRALRKMKRERAYAKKLHAVCDAVETLAKDNVIPFRKDNAA